MIIDSEDWAQISNDAQDFVKLCLDKDPKDRPSAEFLLSHAWLCSDDSKSYQALNSVSKNLAQFCAASNFQKTIISMLAGLKVQQEELSELSNAFLFIDKNQDGTLSLDELKNGLS